MSLPGDSIVDEELEEKVRESYTPIKKRRRERQQQQQSEWGGERNDWLTCPQCDSDAAKIDWVDYDYIEIRCPDCGAWVYF